MIGSLRCFRPLWLARVITLGLALQHSNENRSNLPQMGHVHPQEQLGPVHPWNQRQSLQSNDTADWNLQTDHWETIYIITV